MAAASVDYRQHQLLPALRGNTWTVVIRARGSALCHPAIACDEDYKFALFKAQKIVDGLCDECGSAAKGNVRMR